MKKLKKVMIADDDPAIVDFLEIMLQFEGYDVSSTLNGASLLDMSNGIPDLLLMDIWMSDIDGRDICRHLKQRESTRNLPIVMISASKDIERSAMESGADDFLSKPFEMNVLLKMIAQNIS